MWKSSMFFENFTRIVSGRVLKNFPHFNMPTNSSSGCDSNFCNSHMLILWLSCSIKGNVAKLYKLYAEFHDRQKTCNRWVNFFFTINRKCITHLEIWSILQYKSGYKIPHVILIFFFSFKIWVLIIITVLIHEISEEFWEKRIEGKKRREKDGNSKYLKINSRLI